MPKQAYKPAGIRESWRPDSANAEQRASRQRIAWRWVITALLALLFSAFGYLLFSPLFHPTLRLYHLTAGAYELLDIKPIPFFQEDAIRFLSIDGSFRKQDAANEFAVMDTPEAVRKYLQRIVNSTSQKSDVALLHISAHPMIKGERPFLKCSNFKPDALENGSVSVEEILDLLDRMSVGVTLVCLNLGPSDSQSLEDSVRDNVLFSLNDLMKSRKNPNQWVLVSNSPQEGSFASSQLRSSVFSYAVTSALQGSGDFNRDAVIDLDEFSRFVVGFTKSYVRKESGGIAQQNPILIATSANADRALNLIAIASTPQKRSDTSWWESLSTWWSADPSKEETDDKVTDKLAEKVSKEKSWLTEYLDKSSARIQELTMDEIEDNINILPSFLGKQVKKSIGLEEELAESTYSKPQGEASPEEAKAASVDENAGSTNEESTAVTKPSERIGNSIPELSRLADPKSTNLQLLQLAWQYCEYFELPQERAMRPIDVAPHAWNEWITHLHGFEERLRMDAVADAKTIRLQLTSDIVGAYQFAMTGEARVGALAKRLSEQMPALSLPKTALPSIGLMEQLAEHGGAQVPKDVELQIKQLDVAIGMDTSESFGKWVSQLPRDLPTQYVEFFWPQQLASSRPAPWRITRRVVGLWRQYERLAYDPLTSNKDIQNSLVLSRRLLLEGTRQALDQIGADWIDRCLLSLDKAEFLLPPLWTNATKCRVRCNCAIKPWPNYAMS